MLPSVITIKKIGGISTCDYDERVKSRMQKVSFGNSAWFDTWEIISQQFV